MLNLLARFQLGVWFAGFNHPYDRNVEMVLRRGVDSGIQSVSGIGIYDVSVTFKNGYQLNAWNANKYYAWLMSGSCAGVTWKDARPSARTLVRLRDMIAKEIATR